jgi:uncharacterized protein YwgA
MENKKKVNDDNNRANVNKMVFYNVKTPFTSSSSRWWTEETHLTVR